VSLPAIPPRSGEIAFDFWLFARERQQRRVVRRHRVHRRNVPVAWQSDVGLADHSELERAAALGASALAGTQVARRNGDSCDKRRAWSHRILPAAGH
jgi:hypothetical protein